jgi:conjugal transfer/entry exclusion protein
MKLFKKLKNKFNKYKNVINDVQDIKDNLGTVENAINNLYDHLIGMAIDIQNIQTKLEEVNEECP